MGAVTPMRRQAAPDVNELYVCYRGYCCQHFLTWRLTGFDPLRSSAMQLFCIATQLFDHLVDAAEQCNRQRDTERPDDLHVDDKLNAPGLLDRQVGGLLALQNAARVAAGKVELIHNVSAIADQTACEGKAARGMNRGYFGPHRQRGESVGAADAVPIGVD